MSDQISDVSNKVRRKLFTAQGQLEKARRAIHEHIDLLEQVANDKVDRTDENLEMVSESLAAVSGAFKLVENVGEQNFPESFWKTPEGQLLGYGYLWLMGEDLITLKQGACILFDITPEQYTLENKWRNLLNSLTCGRYGKPALTTYYDPTPDVRYPMRLSRSEVEIFKPTYKHKPRAYKPRK